MEFALTYMYMMDPDLVQKNKQRLEQEITHLQRLLSRVANPDKAGGDFHAKYPNLGNDEESNATEVEQYSANIAEEYDLETRLHQVEKAIARIKAGTYGVCTVGGEEISEDRLAAVPEAETCVAHGK